ncbi:uncharacterized protein LOC133794757 isoform X1 [Humulus lupulus]|nr:uncharacterized protein LOC133794757 isoform X1 [Humulus lupulus]
MQVGASSPCKLRSVYGREAENLGRSLRAAPGSASAIWFLFPFSNFQNLCSFLQFVAWLPGNHKNRNQIEKRGLPPFFFLSFHPKFATMTTSKRLADKKVAKFQKNITKRGAVPETSTKKGNDYPVGPILLGFFVFVVIGSSLFQIIRTATSGGMA